MLQDGLPLEGSIKQLCEEMKQNRYRDELLRLEKDLSAGLSLEDSLKNKKLPEIYKRLLVIGAKGGNLAQVLILLSDYYAMLNRMLSQLRLILIYPVIVLCLALFFSIAVNIAFTIYDFGWIEEMGLGQRIDASSNIYLKIPPVFISTLLAFYVFYALVGPFRKWIHWKLPVYKDIKLYQFSELMKVLLNSGCDLVMAIQLVKSIEKGSPLEKELMHWEKSILEGDGKIDQFMLKRSFFPTLFKWSVSSAEHIGQGFAKAAQLYKEKASAKVELFLQGLIPALMIVIGILILSQALVPVKIMAILLNEMGSL